MALIRLDHTPETIKVCTSLFVILPDPSKVGLLPIRSRKVLYLYHGLSDDASAWQRYSSIETVANQYGLVVIMPSVGRSFYTDQPNEQMYFTYLMKELPQYLEDVFGLRPKREDTLLAGLSMGGHGAFKAALLHPEMFGAVASFSGVLTFDFLQYRTDDPRNKEFSYLFGDLTKLPGSMHDPKVWLQKASGNPSNLPKLYVACGKQDDLYPINNIFYEICQQFGIPVDYLEEDGKHDWYFWDRQVKRFIELVLGPPPA